MGDSVTDRSTARLLEREDEIERISEALASARAGTGSLALIEGTAGLGKTELLAMARRLAGDEGMVVVTARGSDLERDRAFGVVRQLLEPLIQGAEPAVRADLFAGAAGPAESLFAAQGAQDGPEEGDVATIQYGLYWLCANAAQVGPIALLVDDAHWSDLASLRFLVYLAGRREGLPLALLVASRPAETPAQEEFLVKFATDPAAVIASPNPLSAGGVAALLADELNREPEARFVEACHAATGGVPFLVRELIRELQEEGLSPEYASVGRVDELGPRTVARAVVARARRLSLEAITVARAVAVLGADADLRRVTALAEADEAVVSHTLDQLTGAGLINSGRPIEYAHPILRSAVYAEIPTGERGRLHVQAAQLLAEEGGTEERIATHLMACDPAAEEETVELMVRVAREALARGAPSSAVAYLRRALAEGVAAERRASLVNELGLAEIRAGDLQAATEHLAEARRLAAEPTERIPAARNLAAALSIQGRYREAAEVIEDLLGGPDELGPDLALALSGELLLEALFEPAIRPEVDRRLGRTDPNRAGGRSPGARTYLSALTMDATLQLRPAAEVRDLATRARKAGIVEEVASGVIAWNQVLFPLMFADGFALAEEMIGEALDQLRGRASIIGWARAYLARSYLHMRRGALSEAIADAHTAVQPARDASFIGQPVGVSVLVDAQVERGDPEGAWAALQEADMDGEIPETFLHSWALAGRARLRLAQGELAEAIADFEELSGRAERFNQVNPGTFGHRSGLALAVLQQGDRERAVSLAEEELELSRRWGARRALGISLRTLGLCRSDDQGMALLRESVEVLDGSGAQLEHAHSLCELGAAIRRSGRRAEAREPLHAAMELAHECGATPLVERAREELLTTGARPRRIMRTGVDALTPSELRVAKMAAEGMTNREIAQALFVTARTVEGHLTHAYQKLDIESRNQLAERLAAEPDA